MKKVKQHISIFLALLIMIVPILSVNVSAASKIKLNKTSITVNVGESYKLKLSGTKKKITWTSSNKKIATVKAGKVTGKKAGKATITAKVGNKKYKCKVTVHKHSWKKSKVVKPTCTEKGYTLYVCKSNKKHTKKTNIVKALGHKYKKTVVKPTCEASGYDYYVCQNNKKHVKRNNFTKATGHKYISVVTREATCTTAGIETISCKNCDEKTTKVIPQKEHSFVDGICINCGLKETNVVIISAKDKQIELDFENVGKVSQGKARIIRVKASEYISLDKTEKLSDEKEVNGTIVGYYDCGTKTKVTIDRFEDNGYDHIYSKYYIVSGTTLLKGPIYVSEIESQRKLNNVKTETKKGILGEDVNYAKDLGVSHTALNLDMVNYIYPNEKVVNGKVTELSPVKYDAIEYECNGKKYYFNRTSFDFLDNNIKKYTDANISITLIIYSSITDNWDMYPNSLAYEQTASNKGTLMGINTSNELGREYWIAFMEFIGERYSRPDHEYGYVSSYVIGNEIDETNKYYRLIDYDTKVSLETFMEEYTRTLRLASQAVTKYCSDITTCVSFTHYWAKTPPQCYPSNKYTNYYAPLDMANYLSKITKEQGDFNWGIAPHCYGNSLAGCWGAAQDSGLDPSQGRGMGMNGDFNTSAQLTFSNLEILQDYLEQPHMLYKGKTRNVYLTEQGCSSYQNTKEHMNYQAAYTAYAYYKSVQLDCIVAFNYYRMFDHQAEVADNARFGLLYHEQLANGEVVIKKKPAYNVYKYIDTDKTYEVSNPYLSYIKYFDEEGKAHSAASGDIKSWKDTMTVFKPGWDWEKVWNDDKIIYRKAFDEYSLSTDKTTYTVGEDILVTASGSTTDWVGIYAEDDKIGEPGEPGTQKSIYWYYVTEGNISGNACNIKNQHHNSERADLKNLPAGKYKIVLLADGGYDVIKQISITIEENTRDLKTDKTKYNAGEDIMVTATGTGSDWVGIYKTDDVSGTGAGTVESIYWYNVSDDNHVSGTAYNIKQQTFNPTRADFKDLPAGKYKIILFADGGYDIIKQIDIEIISAVTLKTDKNIYLVGENIMVTALGKGSDWVGIYTKSDNIPNDTSIYWYNVTDDNHVSGNAYNIKEQSFNSEREAYASLPAGEYKIVLFADGGYDIISQTEITITAVKSDKTDYLTGEDIMISAVGSNKDWVGLCKKGETIGSGAGTVASIYWYYVSDTNHISGEAYNIKLQDTSPSRVEDLSLPAGEYVIFLLENDSYNVIGEYNITIHNKSVETDKSEYTVGENIMVTATGTGADWVGIYKIDDVVGSGAGTSESIYWYNVSDNEHESDKAYNIKEQIYNPTRADLKELPAGEYRIILFADGGYTQLDSKIITIK